MRTKTRPAVKRVFSGPWDEITYLYDQIIYWYYERSNQKRALTYCPRLHTLLKQHASKHEAIFGEECWSLLYELRGNYRAAIRHREREIDLILKLWEISQESPVREIVLAQYDPSDLCDRIELLAILYREVGNLDRAIVLLVESRQLCEKAGIPFEGKQLLQDYLEERNPNLAKVLQTQST
jgi:hypothetical protein